MQQVQVTYVGFTKKSILILSLRKGLWGGVLYRLMFYSTEMIKYKYFVKPLSISN